MFKKKSTLIVAFHSLSPTITPLHHLRWNLANRAFSDSTFEESLEGDRASDTT